MSFSSAKESLLSTLSGPPETSVGQSVLLNSLFLTALLVVIVPIVTLTTGIPILALVAVAGLLYATTLLATENVFAGLCAAVLVLVTFYANVPLAELPVGGGDYTTPQLNLLLVDIAAVPFAGLCLWWLFSGSTSLSFGRERIAGYALAGFVSWSLLAALVANGPSRLAALFYVVVQLRYLILFGIGAVIVRHIGIHNAVYSLSIAIFGQLAYAIAEVLNQGSFGLTYLGDSSGGPAPFFSVGPLLFQSSQYAGGFAGTSRVLVGLLLLVIPIIIAIISQRSVLWKVGATVALVASVFLVRVSETDTGWMAFLLTAFLTAAALCVFWITTDSNGRMVRHRAIGYLSGIGSAIGSMALSVFLFSQREISRTSGPSESGSADVAGSDGASSGGVSSEGGSDPLVQLISHVPFIETANLSIRFQQYVAAIAIGLQYPLFGIGGMNFPLVAESYGLPHPIAIHNIYLSVLASTGIPGMILFSVSIGTVLVVAGQKSLSSENDRLFWLMLVCGMLGFHAYNFWVTLGSGVGYLVFWVLAGVVVGAYRQQGRTNGSNHT